MTALTGTTLYLRLAWRLERVRVIVLPAVILGLLWAVGDSMGSLYPNQASRDEYAGLNALSPVIRAINGPGHALDRPGGIVVFEVGGYLLVVMSLMAVILVVRGTRGEEASGRAELTLAARTGAAAQLCAVLLLSTATCLLTGAGAVVVLLALGLPASGALLYGAGLAMVGLVFGGVAALAAQLASQPSAALGLAGAGLGAAYALRAVGDVGDGHAAWLSPLGWAQAAAPFATTGEVTERWWPVAVGAGAAVLLSVAALVLRARRELGASLLTDRPGPAVAGAALRGPVAGALRSARGTLLGWGAGALSLGAAFGAAAEDIDAVFSASEGIDTLLGFGDGSIKDGYFTFALLILVSAGSGLGLALVARLRAEERAGLAEIVLATRVSRVRWLGAGAVTAAVATTTVMVAAALGLGAGYAVASGDVAEMGRIAVAALLFLPGAWLLVAAMLLLVGVAPRATWVGWILFGVSAVVSLLGSALQLERPFVWLSPFEHLPGLPIDGGTTPVVVICAMVVAAAVAAFLGIRRRDIPN